MAWQEAQNTIDCSSPKGKTETDKVFILKGNREGERRERRLSGLPQGCWAVASPTGKLLSEAAEFVDGGYTRRSDEHPVLVSHGWRRVFATAVLVNRIPHQLSPWKPDDTNHWEARLNVCASWLYFRTYFYSYAYVQKLEESDNFESWFTLFLYIFTALLSMTTVTRHLLCSALIQL